ncbi:hypothetical protein IEO21_00925 [Rhodonia placenta]|uniref:Metal homeostatis protein bsd2 n=1 Tax=Rhodonia placenta TaxID=104341 RepID=A0A8H7PAD5_9APHY|nr:hypothetical protein IEO21_00925 [Postia placenta]
MPMSARYAPLPNPLTDPTADHELEAAFDDSDSDDDDVDHAPSRRPARNGYHPLAHDDPIPAEAHANADAHIHIHIHTHTHTPAPARVPGTYDFESTDFDYIRPPPGSPPSPSDRARPNEHGNSNGLVPAPPTDADPRPSPRAGWVRRTAAAVLPTHYVQRLGLEQRAPLGYVGGGTHNDGVFANVVAKPARPVRIQEALLAKLRPIAAPGAEIANGGCWRNSKGSGLVQTLSKISERKYDGSVPSGDETYLVPEDVQKDTPPSYAAAQADAAPPYWETTVHAPSSASSAGEIIIDALPTGSVFSFLWNMLVSISFQFVGFLLTYLLHTTHAAKLGSRAGLGITLIQYGFAMRRNEENAFQGETTTQDVWSKPAFATPTEADEYYKNLNATGTLPTPTANDEPGTFIIGTSEWISFLLMTVGWFILLTSLLGFWRVKRWERGILAAQREDPSAGRPSGPANGALIHSLERVFGLQGLADGSLIRTGLGLSRNVDRDGDAEALLREMAGPAEPERPPSPRGEYILPLDPDDPERNARVAQALAVQARLDQDLRSAGLI